MKTAEEYNSLKIKIISLINLIDGYLMDDKDLNPRPQFYRT
jgi:hypothetical protein